MARLQRKLHTLLYLFNHRFKLCKSFQDVFENWPETCIGSAIIEYRNLSNSMKFQNFVFEFRQYLSYAIVDSNEEQLVYDFFTHGFSYKSFGFFIFTSKDNRNFFAFFDPVDIGMWLCIIISVLVISSVLYSFTTSDGSYFGIFFVVIVPLLEQDLAIQRNILRSSKFFKYLLCVGGSKGTKNGLKNSKKA